jgi:hypothetical protein
MLQDKGAMHYPGAGGSLELRGGAGGRGVEAEDMEGRGDRIQYPPRIPLAAAVRPARSGRRGTRGSAAGMRVGKPPELPSRHHFLFSFLLVLAPRDAVENTALVDLIFKQSQMVS